MTIPFKVKLLTDTAKPPHQNCNSDLWDLFADDFCEDNLKDMIADGAINALIGKDCVELLQGGRILVKTGIALELPTQWDHDGTWENSFWDFEKQNNLPIFSYAVADLRARSGLAIRHGLTVLNAPATIDNSYRKEIGVILYNAGHEPYTINKGDKIAQMLIRPLYPSKMEIVDNVEDTGRGGYNSTGY